MLWPTAQIKPFESIFERESEMEMEKVAAVLPSLLLPVTFGKLIRFKQSMDLMKSIELLPFSTF